jgi:hypothetical protein
VDGGPNQVGSGQVMPCTGGEGGLVGPGLVGWLVGWNPCAPNILSLHPLSIFTRANLKILHLAVITDQTE